MLMGRLQFPGDCSQKSGSDPSKFSADYIEHLGRSFEAQTWVYEQAVCSGHKYTLTSPVWVDYVDMVSRPLRTKDALTVQAYWCVTKTRVCSYLLEMALDWSMRDMITYGKFGQLKTGAS
jgi:hypothetical protein